MSTEANIAFVKKAYADFQTGDIAAILDSLSDDIEWITPGKGLPTAGVRHGKAEVAAFFQAVNATWDMTVFEPKQFIASGDMVASVGSYTAVSRATGNAATADWVMLWVIRDGKLTWFKELTDTLALSDALAANAVAA